MAEDLVEDEGLCEGGGMRLWTGSERTGRHEAERDEAGNAGGVAGGDEDGSLGGGDDREGTLAKEGDGASLKSGNELTRVIETDVMVFEAGGEIGKGGERGGCDVNDVMTVCDKRWEEREFAAAGGVDDGDFHESSVT
jgi:hypothetical protein